MSKQTNDRAEDALRQLAESLRDAFKAADISPERVQSVLRDTLSDDRLADDLAELYRRGRAEVNEVLASLGLVAPAAKTAHPAAREGGWTASTVGRFDCDGIRIGAAGPALDAPFPADQKQTAALDREWAKCVAKIREPDPFLDYYRNGVDTYVARYRLEFAERVRDFAARHFSDAPPAHLVTVGIGANEQFWHYVQQWRAREKAAPAWHVCNNPKDLARLPETCTVDNTLFMEFSRSGKTQEVVKVHEFLPSNAKRIVFANTGPLAELAERDSAVCERMPTEDQIPGRFGKNLSPMLIAPMEYLGLPVEEYWERIGACINAWDLTDPASPPAALARYIRAAQVTRGVNHIYMGTNDDLLLMSADELVQFWNEGVTKGENDITLSRYFGLPRDSHLNIEAILANAATKMGIFLLRKGGGERFAHPLIDGTPHAINPGHEGLTVAAVDYALAKANADHFATKMPAITIELNNPTLLDSATLSQLYTDTVYVYSLMLGVNPGSNPEVKLVRERSDALLAEHARKR